MEEIGQRDAEQQRDGRHDFEIDHGLEADATDLLQVARTRDPQHDDAKDDRRDQHLDQLDECIAERLQARPELGIEHADRDADDQSDDNLAE